MVQTCSSTLGLSHTWHSNPDLCPGGTGEETPCILSQHFLLCVEVSPKEGQQDGGG